MAKNKRDLAREARWRGLLAAQRKSGLSVRAFCARERVTEPSFYAWRREIGLRDQEKAGAAMQSSAFVPVMVAGNGAGQEEQVTIEVRGGRVLHVPATLPAARVTELVRAVEAAS
jgi:hypothetical protein